MTLLNSALKTADSCECLGVEMLLKSGLNVGDETSTAEYWKDPAKLERWCREHGLLIEINDADYDKPKLAVAS